MNENPFNDSVAAISVGIFKGFPLLDLNYSEDKAATVDANFVMTGNQRFVEVQSSGEEASFSQEEFNQLVKLAKLGIVTLHSQQNALIDNCDCLV